jgi:glucoamylase
LILKHMAQSPSDWAKDSSTEAGLRILLASQVYQRLGLQPSPSELEMIRASAATLLNNGPQGGTDRWKRAKGYSPESIAVAIAALREAAAITGEKSILAAIERWQPWIETWTYRTDDASEQKFYLNVSEDGNPNAYGPVDWVRSVDGGFLQLVRLGVRSAEDPRILSTLNVYQSSYAQVASPLPGREDVFAFRRYYEDKQGPLGHGGYWTELTAERGIYSVAARQLSQARDQLQLLELCAQDTGLFPQQTMTLPSSLVNIEDVSIADSTPAPWAPAHAQHVLLHRSIEEGIVFGRPKQDPQAAQ